MPVQQFEKRIMPIETSELRSVEGETPKITGYASKYGNWYPVYDFLERVAQGAFDAALADKETDVVASMNHNTDLAFARQSAGTLRLQSNSVGLLYEADVTDEDGQRVYNKVRSGTLRGSSFMFTVAEDKWEFKEGETPRRTIMRFDKLYELGPVVWPANADTTVKARADEILAEARSRHMAKNEPKATGNRAENAPESQKTNEKPPEKAEEGPKTAEKPVETISDERKREIDWGYKTAERIINRNTRRSPDV